MERLEIQTKRLKRASANSCLSQWGLRGLIKCCDSIMIYTQFAAKCLKIATAHSREPLCHVETELFVKKNLKKIKYNNSKFKIIVRIFAY